MSDGEAIGIVVGGVILLLTIRIGMDKEWDDAIVGAAMGIATGHIIFTLGALVAKTLQ